MKAVTPQAARFHAYPARMALNTHTVINRIGMIYDVGRNKTANTPTSSVNAATYFSTNDKFSLLPKI